MSDIKLDIPDITVVVNKGEHYTSFIKSTNLVVTNEDNFYRAADIATSASYALTASYVLGEAGVTDWTEITNKPTVISSSTQVDYNQLQNLPEGIETASYVEYVNVANKPTLVSSSTQIQLDQISGTTFANQSFNFPSNLTVGGTLTATEYNIVSSSVIYASGSTKFGDTLDDIHQFTGSVLIDGNLIVPSITASFKGDGSQLTGLATDLRISASIGSDTIQLLSDDLTVIGANGIVTSVAGNIITIDVPDTLIATASIADNITVIHAGIYETGSDSVIIPTPGGGLSYIVSASYATTASFASNVNIIGSPGYIPVWNSFTTLTPSRMYQSASSIFIGGTSTPLENAPEALGVYGGTRESYNGIYVDGTINNYYQNNITNSSDGVSASTDIIATADTGTELVNYIDMGINGSGYTLTDFIGGPLDAYLYSAGSELLIGNIVEDKGITFFTGGPNIANTGRMFITADGVVGINTTEVTLSNPETLFVRALSSDTHNLVTAKSNTDQYSQINVQNESTGSFASTDVVATADNGDEVGNFINIGINSSQYTGHYDGDYGHAGDAYLYNTGSHLHIGNATPDNFVSFFAGGTDFDANTKLILGANNQHSLFGNLEITGSLQVTSSIQSGSAVVSTTVNTIEVMTSASYALITPVSGTLYVIQG